MAKKQIRSILPETKSIEHEMQTDVRFFVLKNRNTSNLGRNFVQISEIAGESGREGQIYDDYIYV